MKNLNPNFYHRYTELFHDERDLSDSIHIMADRALAVLHLLSTQFESEGDNTLCHTIIYDSLGSVITELNDIQAYLQATKKPR